MLINNANLLIMDGLTMKLFILLFALLSASNAFAGPACNRDGILDNLIDYQMMKFENKEFPMYLGMKTDFAIIKKYTKDCPVITSDTDPSFRLKTDFEKMDMLLTNFHVSPDMKKINMRFKAGESFDDIKKLIAPMLDSQLSQSLYNACNFKAFYKTFVNIKYTAATKTIEPPLPSYDGSSAEFIGFKTDKGLIAKFLNTCFEITSGDIKYPLNKAKLQSAMKKLEAANMAKPMKALGYMGGVWNEGDYYMSSEEQLEGNIEFELLKVM
jgi:hypothetical protein